MIGVDTGGDCLTGGVDQDKRDEEMFELLNEFTLENKIKFLKVKKKKLKK